MKHAGESGGRGLSFSWVGEGQMLVVTTSMPFLFAGVLFLVIARISACRSTLKLQFDVFLQDFTTIGVPLV